MTVVKGLRNKHHQEITIGVKAEKQQTQNILTMGVI
jgi:hypothetical protein